jgi:hypothetical protein
MMLPRTAQHAYRDFPGRRWLIVALRGLHLAGMVGFGAELLAGRPGLATPYVWLLAGTGAAMVALDAWSNPLYLQQYCGAAMLLKLGLLVWLAADAEWRLFVFWAVLALSALVAHAPARVRHRRLFSRSP